MGDKYLSDVIDLKRDILPYQIVQIFSGVGSGKNYWVETLSRMKGENGRPYNILLITSRKTTANAQAQKMKAERWIDLDEFVGDGIGRKRQIKCVCTNSGIEQFTKKKYQKTNKKTHIWNEFDFIILDEAHSLATDATFSDAPFYVEQFIKWSVRENKKCHVILMSGTPEPIEWLFSKERKEDNRFNTCDWREKCRSVEPKKIWIETQQIVEKEILKKWKCGEKVIYFVSSISKIKKMLDWFSRQKEGKIINDIGIAYASDEKDEIFRGKYDVLLNKKSEIQQALESEECLPDDIKIFLTTSKNKEGVNINNTDIKTMYADSTQRAELIQMAGRVRNGLDSLHIVYDDPWYLRADSKLRMMLDRECVKAVEQAVVSYKEFRYEANCNATKAYAKFKEPLLSDKAIIAQVENSFPSIRYDYFGEKWLRYDGRVHGLEQLRLDTLVLNEYIETWTEGSCAMKGIFDGETGEEKFKKGWFPHSELTLPVIADDSYDCKAYLIAKFEELLRRKGYLDCEITRTQRDEVKLELNEELGRLSDNDLKKCGISYPVRNLMPALKKMGFAMEQKGKHASGKEKYVIMKEGAKNNLSL